MSYARKVDSNHGEIADALRRVGWLVHDTSRLPGFCDFVAFHPGRQIVKLIEVKAEKGTLTALQQLMRQEGWPVVIVRSREEALAL